MLELKQPVCLHFIFVNVCVCVFPNAKRRVLFFFPTFLTSCSVSVGMEMMFCAEGCTAVIDTGSSYITGPASSVSVLMKTIGAQLDESGVSVHTCNMVSHKKTLIPQKFICLFLFAIHPCVVHQYKVNCDAVKTLPSVTFHLGGHEYSLAQEDYILWVSTTWSAKSFKYFFKKN